MKKNPESTTFIYPIFYKYGTLTEKDDTYFWSSRPRGFPSFIQTTLGIPASDWTEQWSVAALPLETTRSLGSSRNVSSVKLVVAVSIKKQICNKSVILVFIQKSWNFSLESQKSETMFLSKYYTTWIYKCLDRDIWLYNENRKNKRHE